MLDAQELVLSRLLSNERFGSLLVTGPPNGALPRATWWIPSLGRTAAYFRSANRKTWPLARRATVSQFTAEDAERRRLEVEHRQALESLTRQLEEAVERAKHRSHPLDDIAKVAGPTRALVVDATGTIIDVIPCPELRR